MLTDVTVCTVGSEPWRGSLSDRILIAENRCTALFVSTVSTDSETRIGAAVGAGCRPPARNADPHPYMDKAMASKNVTPKYRFQIQSPGILLPSAVSGHGDQALYA